MKGEKDETSVDCREALHRVYHFLDGELTSERRDQIARHLDKCSPCVEVFGSRPRSGSLSPTGAEIRCQRSCAPA
jgi:hypothetical protein